MSVLTTTYCVFGFFFGFFPANFFLSQTTLSDARTPMLTTPPYPFLFPSLSPLLCGACQMPWSYLIA